MRILFLTQWFHPEPSFKGLAFARELVKRGHRVQVLTGFPNYPGGKLYPGYQVKLAFKEVVDGIEVVRVPLYPSHDRNAVKRALNYLSFALSAATIGALRVKQADVAYIYHPPATLGIPLVVVSWLRRIPCVYDINDLWPDTLSATGMIRRSAIIDLVHVWCKIVYTIAKRIVVVSPGFKRALVARGVSPDKVALIYNWGSGENDFKSGAKLCVAERERLKGRFNIIFAGNMGPAQELGVVIDAAKLISASARNVQFVFVGDGIDCDELRAAADGVDNVVFLPRRPSTEMAPLFSAAEALLVHLKDDPLFAITIPSKLQTYLGAGRPILAGLRGDGAELVAEAKAGFVFEPGRPEALARVVMELVAASPERRAEMGESGRRYYLSNLCFSAGVDAFEREFVAAARQSDS